MDVTQPVESLVGVGPAQAKKLKQLNILTISDLLRYFPRDYQDYSKVTPIIELKPGRVTVKGFFKQVKGRYVRRGLHITEAVLSDETGSVRVLWFNQPYRAKAIKSDEEYYISGVFDLSRQHLQITNPTTEKVSEFPAHTARIVPIYRQTKNIKSTELRKAIKAALQAVQQINSNLPQDVEKRHKLISLHQALNNVHFPKNETDLEKAKRRLGFEEIFELILANMVSKQELNQETSLPIKFDRQLAKDFVSHLPFQLTDGQKMATWAAIQDIQKSSPMNRLVEGDVGAGKTVVAAMLIAMAMKQGFQAAIMAPTEILARQHAQTLYDLLNPLDMANQVGLLVGSLSKSQKEVGRERIKNGSIKCLVGTHALIQESVELQNLGIVIIDEQHRFGVEQRKKLLKKAGHMPHMLSMTATPIPRSLALTVYGDLDISVLADKPKGRLPIITKLVQTRYRNEKYKQIEELLDQGQQAFVVCPHIEEQTATPAKSVTATQKELQKLLPKKRIGLLHGKLKADDKQKVMLDFVNKRYDVLVSTTVIEVGVDVPNATVMCIESPERFGLAQIHQLRGRVGRGDKQGYCYLFLSDEKPASPRLRAIEQSQDGFKLAEFDLETRGPGAIYGTSQHGLLDLRMVNITDVKLISEARKAAQLTIKNDPNLLQYPGLKARINELQKIVHLN